MIEQFLTLPPHVRKHVINTLINVRALGTYIKGGDAYRYAHGLKTNAFYKKCLYSIVMDNSIN